MFSVDFGGIFHCAPSFLRNSVGGSGALTRIFKRP